MGALLPQMNEALGAGVADARRAVSDLSIEDAWALAIKALRTAADVS
jgi:hypothetical protein